MDLLEEKNYITNNFKHLQILIKLILKGCRNSVVVELNVFLVNLCTSLRKVQKELRLIF